jgi:type II secretory pathway pseudopilin PulG
MIALIIACVAAVVILPRFFDAIYRWQLEQRNTADLRAMRAAADDVHAQLADVSADLHSLAGELKKRAANDKSEKIVVRQSHTPHRMEVDVHGEAQRNPDGKSRQDIIAQLKEGEYITLVHEPNNPYDKNAVRVDSALGTIGYVARDEAMKIARLLDEKAIAKSYIDAILGGDSGMNYGVKLTVETANVR